VEVIELEFIAPGTTYEDLAGREAALLAKFDVDPNLKNELEKAITTAKKIENALT
jgi:hypothetical protein